MAHQILGVDLGAHSVKVAVLEVGFKRTRLSALHERPLAPARPPVAGEPAEDPSARAIEALGSILTEHHLDAEFTYLAVPGDRAILRLLAFPFADPRQIAQTVSYEFEGQIPCELADLAFAHQILGTPVRASDGGAAEDPEKSGADGARVLCAGARRETVAKLIAALTARGIEARAVGVAPLVYQRACRSTYEDDTVRLVVDIGHERTNVVAVRGGSLLFARTLSRGGRHVTRAIAQALSVPETHAEAVKHGQLRRLGGGPGSAPAERAAFGEAVALARDLRQTAAAIHAAWSVAPSEIALCGSGSRLAGLHDVLAAELELPVVPFRPALGEADPDGIAEIGGPSGVQAVALALEGASGRLPFDLRSGELAYRSDLSFLRARAGHLATCLLAILAFMAVDAFAALRELRKEQTLLTHRFDAAAAMIAPGGKLTADRVIAMLQHGKQAPGSKSGGGPTLLPKESAAAMLEDVSRAMPPGDALKLDITHIAIQPQSMSLKGTITTGDVDSVKAALKKGLPCIDSFGSVNITNDGKDFDMTIAHHCE